MDDETFDRIARRFDTARTRRAIVGGLGAAGLLAALGGPGRDVLAKRKKKKKKCKAERIDQTCAGTCGSVKNNCKKAVECGCGLCQRCNTPTRTCETVNDQIGESCGTDKVCLANGSCADCGGTDQPCCPGNNCVGLNDCVSGTCRACGVLGGPCCSDGNQCIPFFGTGCFAGTCEVCGAAGQQCCPGGICNFVGLSCDSGTCL